MVKPCQEFVIDMAHTDSIESVWAILKHGINGIYNISSKYLERHVGKFAFKLNEGTFKIDTMYRVKNVVLNMQGNRVSYEDLIK